MKGLLLLIAVGGLLALGWINRERFFPQQTDTDTTITQEGTSSPAQQQPPSPASRLGGGIIAASTPHPAREAQARAAAIYPGIARANTPLNLKFVALYKEAQTSNPAVLASPDWPLDLAERAVVSLGGAPMARTAAAAPNAAPAARQLKPRKNVVVYTTAHCPYCTKAKQYLTQKGVSYREVNIETSSTGKQEFKKLNGSGVPLITVDGEVIRGFSQSALDRLL